MSVNRMFDSIEQAREAANWRAALGEPQVIDDKTIIPVAQVSYGFGLSFGRGGQMPEDDDEPESGGEGGEGLSGGGGVSTKPYGVIVVTPENVYFEETEDSSKIAVMGIVMVAFSIFQVSKTLRVIFGRK